MVEHKLELQFRMDDLEDNNSEKGEHAHSDENGHKGESNRTTTKSEADSKCLRSY